ncbi:hypothetical protein COF68_05130 [Bacillus toyonensis]|uniref:hypothetical protein n=1 Tax=Bacillus toyonensis TaxID=155322 RepID=UPI000BFE4ADA|nr:hypothetical protein [Bacillus toyonensis]PHE64229.1 hypothetical protein COF68_05130 [Bacillus toyonensis]
MGKVTEHDFLAKAEECATSVSLELNKYFIDRTVDEMKLRRIHFLDEQLTKLEKLQMITAYKSYDGTRGNYEPETRMEVISLAFKHTVSMINEVLGYTCNIDFDKKTSYKTLVDGHVVLMNIAPSGFHLQVFDNGKCILNRLAGTNKYRFNDKWITDKVGQVNSLDTGKLIRVNEMHPDTYEVRVIVGKENVESMKDKLKVALYSKGLTTNIGTSINEGWSVENAIDIFAKTERFEDTISLKLSYYTNSFQDLQQGLKVINDVLVKEGY